MSIELLIPEPDLEHIPSCQVALLAYQEWFRYKFRLEPSSSLDLYSEYYKVNRAIPAEKRSFKDAVLLYRLLEIDSRQKVNGNQRLVDMLLQDKDKINPEMAMSIASEINLPEFLEYKRQFGGLMRILTSKVGQFLVRRESLRNREDEVVEMREIILKRILDLRRVLVSTFSEIIVAKTLESQMASLSVSYTSIQEDTGNGVHKFKGDLWLRRESRRELLMVDVKFTKPCSNLRGYEAEEHCIDIYTSDVFDEIDSLVDRNYPSVVVLRLDRESWDLISTFLRRDMSYAELLREFADAMAKKNIRREIK